VGRIIYAARVWITAASSKLCCMIGGKSPECIDDARVKIVFRLRGDVPRGPPTALWPLNRGDQGVRSHQLPLGRGRAGDGLLSRVLSDRADALAVVTREQPDRHCDRKQSTASAVRSRISRERRGAGSLRDPSSARLLRQAGRTGLKPRARAVSGGDRSWRMRGARASEETFGS
jgi:hypothetical protein